MDSLSQHDEHESCAKRLKLDLSEPKISVLCDGSGFGEFSTFREVHIDASEGVSPDCDSGYDASTMESAPTPVHITSPNTDTCDTNGDTHESLSEMADPDLEDDNVSTVSNISDLSGLSELSGQDWKPFSGSILWVQKQMSSGIDPRTLLSTLGTDLSKIPDYMDDVTLWKVIINMMAEPPRRHKLRHVNTLDDVVRLLKGSKNIIVLTGAGVSVSCGIPDFRSRDGIYSRLAVDFPDLPDPQAMFDIQYFKQDPRPFFKFAKDIYPGQFQPSPCHRFIKLLEKHNKLLRNYTQNIDTLENVAGIERVVECHGSFATATCTRCSYKVDADAIRDAVCQQRIPMCPKCMEERETVQSSETHYKDMVSQGIMKPDIVFFGEGLPDHFHEAMVGDKSQCDLLIVIGSSLKVRPVALIPSSLPEHVPQILINREPLPHCHFDVELLGDCDIIINQLCYMLNSTWTEGCWLPEPLKETTQLLPLEKSTLPSYNISMSTSDTDEKLLSPAQKSKAVTDKEIESESQLVEDSNSYDKNSEETHETQQVTSTVGDSSSNLTLGTSIKERHISIDSARDSGIGDISNHTDTCSNPPTNTDNFDNVQLGMRDFWEPKLKRSLASRLPENSYYLVPPSRYIFPGAEVFYDPDENYIFSDDSSESESSESDSESESGDTRISQI